MITIFSTCKPFENELDISNQTNAILSWQELTDDVILFGNERGVAKIAKMLGMHHVSNIRCNEWGTPLIPALFSEARRLAQHEFLCYVNADIILLRDFVIAVKCIAAQLPEFLMIGRRWNLPSSAPRLLIGSVNWQERVGGITQNRGQERQGHQSRGSRAG